MRCKSEAELWPIAENGPEAGAAREELSRRYGIQWRVLVEERRRRNQRRRDLIRAAAYTVTALLGAAIGTALAIF